VTTIFSNQWEGGVHRVGASDDSGEYVLWQVESEDQSRVYFEYDDQSNGGYDNVTQVVVMRDGIHVVLTLGKMVHYYFSMSKELNASYENFVQGLKEVYRTTPAILEVQS
jgi:hypothetical protein